MDFQVWMLVSAATALTVSFAFQDTAPAFRSLRVRVDGFSLPPAVPPSGLYDTPVAPAVPSGLYETPLQSEPESAGLLQTPSEVIYSPSDTFQDPSEVFDAPAAPSDLFEAPAVPSDLFDALTAPSDLFDAPTAPSDLSQRPAVPFDLSQRPAVPSDLSQRPAVPSDLSQRPAVPSDVYETPSEQDGTPSASDPRLQEAAQSLQPEVARPMEGMPYDFQFGVDDPESGNSYSHVENSDGRTTQGEYRVLLPDGRTQVVKFFDNGQGFTATVTYI